MKKFLKIAFWILLPIMLVAAFYGYHFYRAKALEKMRYSDADVSAVDVESAVNMLIYSMELDKGLKCEPLPERLSVENVNDYMEVEMTADVYRLDTILDSRIKKHRGKLGRTSIVVYERNYKIGCYDKLWSSSLNENEDSLFGVRNVFWLNPCGWSLLSPFPRVNMNSQFYVGKRRKGVVTECVIYGRYLFRFKKPVNPESVQRIEIDSVSGRKAKYISKKRGQIPYAPYETEKKIDDPFLYDNSGLDTMMLFDSLGRLVESNMKGKVFRYEHLTNDTANLNVKIYSESGKNIGFYKRSFAYNGNRQTVRYGTNFYEVNEKRYYENGKLIKETSNENRFYFSLRSRVRLFDFMENEILDSSFYEHTFLPGTRFDAHSHVIKRNFENGKIKKDERYEETFKRSLSFIFSSMESEKIKKVKNLKFEYDQMGTLKSMVDVLHGNRVFFSKEMQDSLPMCSDDKFQFEFNRLYNGSACTSSFKRL